MDTSPLIPDNNSQERVLNDENYLLGGRDPIPTIFSLLAGPLLSQLTNAVYGIVNSYWISKGIGSFGLEVLSTLFLFDCFAFSFSNLMTVSASSHISYLFGQKREKEANQLVADLFRVGLILGILYPSIILPSSKPIVKWLSDSDEIAEGAFHYLCCTSGGSFILFSFNLMCGILQGEGRTWLFGSMQVLALCIDMLILLPLFIFKFHLGIWSAGLAQIISQFIPLVILMTLLLCGKLSLSVNAKSFFSKFSDETWKSIKVGFASFILNLSESFPQFALQKLIMIVATHVGQLTEMLTLFSIFGRLYTFVVCILVAFDSAFLPSASYAYGKKLYSRVVKLSFHTLWITIVWATICTVIVMFFPKQIVSLFVKDESVLEAAKNIMIFGFISLPLYTVHSIVISFLQSAKQPIRASILSLVTTLIPIPVIAGIIYSVKRDSLKWIYSIYIFNDIATTLISLIGAAKPMYQIWKTKDGEEFEADKIQNNTISATTSCDSLQAMTD